MLRQDVEYTIFIIGTLFGAFVLSETLRLLIRRLERRNDKSIKVDPTNFNFLKNTISFVVYTIALVFIFYKVPSFKALGATLFAGAGIFAAIIALASQQALSNIVSGIFIVVSKPFRVGDYIELNQLHKGTVEDITLRHTVIRDLQNSRIIVPNAKINSETIVNFHLNDERKKEKIEFVVDLNTDVDKAIQIILEETQKHPSFLLHQTPNNGAEELIVRVTKIENGAITLRTMVSSEDPDKAYEMHCDLNYAIKKRFDAEGIKFASRVGFVQG